jgi:hypothetical protein
MSAGEESRQMFANFSLEADGVEILSLSLSGPD